MKRAPVFDPERLPAAMRDYLSIRDASPRLRAEFEQATAGGDDGALLAFIHRYINSVYRRGGERRGKRQLDELEAALAEYVE